MRGFQKRTYMSKKDQEEESEDSSPGWGATALGAGALTIGGDISQNAAMSPMVHQLKKNPKTDIGGVSKETLRDQVDENINEMSGQILRKGDKYYGSAPKQSLLGMQLQEGRHPDPFPDDSDAVLLHPHNNPTDLTGYAHELGHIKGVNDKNENWSVIQELSLGAPGALAGAGLGALTATSKNENIRKAAPLAAAAPMVPGLIEEGRANLNADKILQDAGVSGDDLWDARKSLGKSYAGYLGGAAGLGLGAYGLRKYMDKKYEENDNEGIEDSSKR